MKLQYRVWVGLTALAALATAACGNDASSAGPPAGTGGMASGGGNAMGGGNTGGSNSNTGGTSSGGTAAGGTATGGGAGNGGAATGGDSGMATLCLANQRVQATACVGCGAGTTNAAGDDASGANTSCDVPPSCQGLTANCGAGENCCTSPTVTGGSFNRDNDASYPATVSSFRLDKFEVTVGRFRNFVAAVVGGWTPASGSGKHSHLNSGAGLANSAAGGNEPGWDTTWNTNLPTVKTTWDGSSYLGCDATYQTWTPSSGGNETKPINCVNWYQSAAFCIWDGGFLPSEAEWNYAAAGGNQQRQYPWSSPANSTTIDCSYANYVGAAGGGYCVTPGTSVVGAVSPKGNGLYGQADLAGNVYEWNLDYYGVYAAECSNCANAAADSSRMLRSASFGSDASYLLSSSRTTDLPANRDSFSGMRCARTP